MDVRHRLVAIAALGVGWACIWALAGASVSLLAGVVDPLVVGPGEGPLDMARIVGVVGAPAGVIFGALVTVLERGRSTADIPLLRAAAWGAVAGASLLLLSIFDGHPSNGAVLGACSGVVSVWSARSLRSRGRRAYIEGT